MNTDLPNNVTADNSAVLIMERQLEETGWDVREIRCSLPELNIGSRPNSAGCQVKATCLKAQQVLIIGAEKPVYKRKIRCVRIQQNLNEQKNTAPLYREERCKLIPLPGD